MIRSCDTPAVYREDVTLCICALEAEIRNRIRRLVDLERCFGLAIDDNDDPDCE